MGNVKFKELIKKHCFNNFRNFLILQKLVWQKGVFLGNINLLIKQSQRRDGHLLSGRFKVLYLIKCLC